ncbi:GATA transcription factor [Parasponia andersonii]|uniref:GATA transcription factor n=1 Tax=Parasponia andersonii TaxID=3476 RepID=A0A2P5AV01_PARAD|nr:GATA transcription factor [Parasponia andersonii]
MESLDPAACLMDDLLNFSLDIGEEDEEDDKPSRALASSLKPSGLLGPVDTIRPLHELVEEELEWISNKDAFPAVESFILSDHPGSGVVVSKLHSPVSVLEGGSAISSSSNNSHSSNSSNATSLTSRFGGLKAPCRTRGKRRCRRRRANYADITGRKLCWSQANNNNNNSCSKINGNGAKAEKVKPNTKKTTTTTRMTTTIGRKCQHCGAEKTPQWRAGPYGPKTLCNACGVRYKSGRLVPEYRPASSPSFSSEVHSNSHRKILEMRRVKQMMGMVMKHPLESG